DASGNQHTEIGQRPPIASRLALARGFPPRGGTRDPAILRRVHYGQHAGAVSVLWNREPLDQRDGRRQQEPQELRREQRERWDQLSPSRHPGQPREPIDRQDDKRRTEDDLLPTTDCGRDSQRDEQRIRRRTSVESEKQNQI